MTQTERVAVWAELHRLELAAGRAHDEAEELRLLRMKMRYADEVKGSPEFEAWVGPLRHPPGLFTDFVEEPCIVFYFLMGLTRSVALAVYRSRPYYLRASEGPKYPAPLPLRHQ